MRAREGGKYLLFRLLCVGLVLLGLVVVQPVRGDDAPVESPDRPLQYKSDGIEIAGASAEEQLLPDFSLAAALRYVEEGATAWTESRKCVSCHTNGAYLQLRPALSSAAGPPSADIRTFFVQQMHKMRQEEPQKLRSGIVPTQAAYIALGLAEWDRHITKSLSLETEAALQLMFSAQAADGSWSNAECWPPYESSAYHSTTIAAMAAGTAPTWLDGDKDAALQAGVERMRHYLQQTEPPHDYARVLLLWASTRFPGLLERPRQEALIELIWQHQRPDGGWSMRSFAEPEAWGKGKDWAPGGRADRLRAEPDFASPASDGHQTGFVMVVLCEAGVAADDPRIVKGVEWLRTNQQQSGRWWTRSLNTDGYHFITYSGTLFPLLALERTGSLPSLTTASISEK